MERALIWLQVHIKIIFACWHFRNKYITHTSNVTPRTWLKEN